MFSWALDLGGPGTLKAPHQLNGTEGLSGANPDGSDSGSGDVYISPKIYKEKEPAVQCNPPCNLILPPITLPTPTTITFPPYETSLHVAWPVTKTMTIAPGAVTTSAGFDRTVITTTITVPPVTTSIIDVWNWKISDRDVKKSTHKVTKSILASPFVITVAPNQSFKPSITGPYPVSTRTITPPPYPWHVEDEKDNKDDDKKNKDDKKDDKKDDRKDDQENDKKDDDDDDDILPPIIYSQGPAKPKCTEGRGCGRKCKVPIFCNKPCLFNCGPKSDWVDPIDPDPPAPPGCRGPKCPDPDCRKGDLCVNSGCRGKDCVGGSCIGPRCSICIDGDCSKPSGCKGKHCGSDGRCRGPLCISWSELCIPTCKPAVSWGKDSDNGFCSGSDCEQGEECTERQRAPRCTEYVRKTSRGTTSTSTTSTTCSTVTACSVKPTTVTTTSSINAKNAIFASEAFKVGNNKREVLQSIANDIESRQAEWMDMIFTASDPPKPTPTKFRPPPLPKATSYDCDGSIICGGANVGWVGHRCKKARDTLKDDIVYGYVYSSVSFCPMCQRRVWFVELLN